MLCYIHKTHKKNKRAKSERSLALFYYIPNGCKQSFCHIFLYYEFQLTLQNNIKIYHRDKSKFNSEEFCHQLESNLQAFNLQIYNATPDNFNQLIAEFVALIENTIEIHVSLKKLSRKQQKLQSEPCITKGILISVRHKRKLYKSHFLAGTEI